MRVGKSKVRLGHREQDLRPTLALDSKEGLGFGKIKMQ